MKVYKVSYGGFTYWAKNKKDAEKIAKSKDDGVYRDWLPPAKIERMDFSTSAAELIKWLSENCYRNG